MGLMVVVLFVLCISDPHLDQYFAYNDDEGSEFSDLYKCNLNLEDEISGSLLLLIFVWTESFILENCFFLIHLCYPSYTSYLLYASIQQWTVKSMCSIARRPGFKYQLTNYQLYDLEQVT